MKVDVRSEDEVGEESSGVVCSACLPWQKLAPPVARSCSNPWLSLVRRLQIFGHRHFLELPIFDRSHEQDAAPDLTV